MSIEGQCHFLTLAQGRLHMKIKACIRNHLVIFNQILYVSFQVHGNENLLIHDAGHMTKMANILKSFKNLPFGTGGPISM